MMVLRKDWRQLAYGTLGPGRTGSPKLKIPREASVPIRVSLKPDIIPELKINLTPTTD